MPQGGAAEQQPAEQCLWASRESLLPSVKGLRASTSHILMVQSAKGALMAVQGHLRNSSRAGQYADGLCIHWQGFNALYATSADI